MQSKVPEAVETAVSLNAGSKILNAVRDNQLLTAAVLFILWQMDLLLQLLDMDVVYDG